MTTIFFIRTFCYYGPSRGRKNILRKESSNLARTKFKQALTCKNKIFSSFYFVILGYKEFETKIVEKMKKIVLLAAVAATVGVTLYLSCNQNARCNLKRKVREGRRSIDRNISKASRRIEKSVNKAIDNLTEAQEKLQQKTDELNSKLRKSIAE